MDVWWPNSGHTKTLAAIETAQRFSMAHPNSLRPTLAVTL